MYKTVSVHLPFKTIENCRDLGGIETLDGKVIKPGHLIRSADLHKADDQDLLTLDDMGLQHVIDLRTDWEIAAQPDRLMKNWTEEHLPILHESNIAKKEGGQIKAVEDYAKNAAADLTTIYPMLVLNPHAIAMWKKFFQAVIHQPGSYFFHCTQGKDRTGVAAILLEHALGVEESLIRDDYLQTNLYMKMPDFDPEFLKKHMPNLLEDLQRDLSGIFSAKPEYYDALNNAILQHYGSWNDYLSKALELSQEDLDALKSYYLE